MTGQLHVARQKTRPTCPPPRVMIIHKRDLIFALGKGINDLPSQQAAVALVTDALSLSRLAFVFFAACCLASPPCLAKSPLPPPNRTRTRIPCQLEDPSYAVMIQATFRETS